MLGDRRRHQQEEQPRWNAVDRVVRDALGMPAEHNDRPVHQSDQGIAGVRQGDAVADAGAVELLALVQGAEQGLTRFGLVGDDRDLADQFVEHRIAIRAFQIQIDRRRRNQFAQDDRLRIFHAAGC